MSVLTDYACKKEARLGKGLSRQEMRVLYFLADGLYSKEIAKAMGLRPGTVRLYLIKMRHKLGAKTAAHAVSLGMRFGLIK